MIAGGPVFCPGCGGPLDRPGQACITPGCSDQAARGVPPARQRARCDTCYGEVLEDGYCRQRHGAPTLPGAFAETRLDRRMRTVTAQEVIAAGRAGGLEPRLMLEELRSRWTTD